VPADGYVFDLATPHPNRDVEGLRIAVNKAFANLTSTTVDMGDLYDLMGVALDMVSGALAKSSELQAAIDAAEQTHSAMRQATADAMAAAQRALAKRATLATKQVTLPLLAVGTTEVTVAWGQNLGDASYQVEVLLPPGLVGTVTATVKTTYATSCVLTLKSTLAIPLGQLLDVIAFRYA
jgi:hypothetical protein